MAEMESDAAKRQAHLTFLIVGAGPTGVELAGAIAELSHKALTADFRHIRPEAAHILLIEAGPRILASFPEALSARAAQDLQQLGVDIRCGTRVEHVDEEGAQVAGERIAARTIIWAAGVVASAPTGSWLSGAGELGVKTDNVGRVVVNADLTVPGDKNVFVIGDAARFEIGDGKILPGVCPVAMQQGSYVANVIRQRLKSNSSGTLPAAFRYINKGNLATIGRSSAIADFGKFHFTGVVAWFLWLSVHIYFLIGFRNRLLVLIQWAWAYLTFQRGARLITPVVAKPMDLP
jgi:NADH dehydrogenase